MLKANFATKAEARTIYTASEQIQTTKVKKFKPEDAGYKSKNKKTIKGGTAEENARIIKSVLSGDKGPCRDIVCLNAGFAISACRDIKVIEGVRIAEESIDSGKALKTLERLIEFTNSV